MRIITDDEIQVEVKDKGDNFLWVLMGLLITVMVFLTCYDSFNSLTMSALVTAVLVIGACAVSFVMYVGYKIYRSF